MATARKPDPEPVETDDVKVIMVGTALWGVVFLVSLPFYDRLDDAGRGNWLWICGVGFGLGVIGTGMVRRRRAARRRDAASPPLR